MGAKTALLERYGAIGGNLTVGCVGPIMGITSPRDGSLHTEYGEELAELLPLLTSLWLLPSLFPTSREGMRRKFHFIGDLLEKMGVPLMDASLYALVDEFVDQIPNIK